MRTPIFQLVATRLGVWMAGLALIGLTADSLAQPPGPPPGDRPPRHMGPPPGGPPAGLGMGMLLRMPEVRDELGLSDEQVTQLRAKGREMREQFGDMKRGKRPRRGGPPGARGGQGGPPRGERGGKACDGPCEKLEEARAAMEGHLNEVLTTAQFERLKEIGLQARLKVAGPRALLHGELGEELGITDEQREAMRERGKAAREAVHAQIMELRESAQNEVFEELTTEQREKLAQLQGEPFDLPKPKWHEGRQGPPGPRGFGPPGGRGRGPGGPQGPPPPRE